MVPIIATRARMVLLVSRKTKTNTRTIAMYSRASLRQGGRCRLGRMSTPSRAAAPFKPGRLTKAPEKRHYTTCPDSAGACFVQLTGKFPWTSLPFRPPRGGSHGLPMRARGGAAADPRRKPMRV